jgi:hypothetical protein
LSAKARARSARREFTRIAAIGSDIAGAEKSDGERARAHQRFDRGNRKRRGAHAAQPQLGDEAAQDTAIVIVDRRIIARVKAGVAAAPRQQPYARCIEMTDGRRLEFEARPAFAIGVERHRRRCRQPAVADRLVAKGRARDRQGRLRVEQTVDIAFADDPEERHRPVISG